MKSTDSLQMQCAKNYNLDYIVTRNIKDFPMSPVKAVEPGEFLGIVGD